MADKEEPKKKQSTIKQIIQIFKYTHAEDKALPWLCGGVFVAPIVVFVVLGIVFKWSVIGWITSMILAIMFVLLYIFLGDVLLFSAYSLWEKDKNNRR